MESLFMPIFVGDVDNNYLKNLAIISPKCRRKITNNDIVKKYFSKVFVF